MLIITYYTLHDKLCIHTPCCLSFSHAARWGVAGPAQESPSEQTGTTCAPLCGAEHQVELLFPELWGWHLHSGLEPEPGL